MLRRFPGEELLMVVCVAQVSWGRAIDGRLCCAELLMFPVDGRLSGEELLMVDCAGFLGKSY